MTQKATVRDQGTSLQAERDIIIQSGLSLKDVCELFDSLYQQNFPKLLDDARRESERAVIDFANKTYKKLEERVESIEVSKLAEPDVQSSFNTAIQNVAKKGSKLDVDLLSELLGERLGKTNTNDLDLSIELALEVIPKLTRTQLNMIAITKYACEMNTKVYDYQSYEQKCQTVDSTFKDLVSMFLSECEGAYFVDSISLASLGVASTYHTDHISAKPRFIRLAYPFIDIKNVESHCPNLNQVLDFIVSSGLYQLKLSRVGQVIGIMMLKRVFPRLQLNKFIG